MTDISQTNWSEIDDNFNQASPKGAPEGMEPGGVNNTMRAMAGATKRFWDRINGAGTSSNIGDSYTLSYPVTPAGPGHGEIFTWRVPATNTGPSTLDPGIGGAKSIVKAVPGGTGPVESGDLPVGSYVMTTWDSIAAQYVVVNTPVVANFSSIAASLVSLEAHINTVSVADAAGGGAAGAAAASLDARITSQSALWTLNLNNTSVAFVASDRSISLAIKTDIGSISNIITSSFIANDASVSAAIKTDIASVSAAIKTDIASVSAAIKINLTPQLPVAWGTFFGSDASLSRFFGHNFLSVTRSAGHSGVYRIRFSNNIDTSQGICILGNGAVTSVYIKDTGASSGTLTSSYIVIRCFDSTSASIIDDIYVSFTIFAKGPV